MVKGANQGELPALNWLAAARAAQHQQHYPQRNDYLKQAEAEPRAKNAVNTSRCRYLYQQGEFEQARQALDTLVPCSKSNDSLLLLATDLYQAQQDWAALRALLPIINKRQLVDETRFTQLSLTTNSALLTEAADKGEQALDNCWGWFSRAERNNNHYVALYAMGLNRCGRSIDAWKLVYKKIKSAADDDLFAAIPHLLSTSDTEYRQQFFGLESKYVTQANYHVCAAQLYLQNRDFSLAKNHYLQASQLDESNKSTWLGLAECQHQLGEHYGASQSYKQAAVL
ncbi:heme biosynthesis protein HemY [Shewanella marina]|uniref:heme biosynthesis protein HemY n=1 Tax=Shewanella marina TaxID=487319 RepID=UPI000A883677